VLIWREILLLAPRAVAQEGKNDPVECDIRCDVS
jgi:hypothetical protein